MHRLQALCAGAMLLLSLAPLAADEPYKLTGVMGSSTGKLFAVVENAQGKQRLLSEGDELEGGQVRRISAEEKSVLLVFPDREVLLRLTGSARPRAPVQPDYVTDFEQVPDRNLGQAEFQALVQLAKEAETLGEPESTARLNKALGLPADARVIAFEMKRADSSRELLEMMSPRLEAQQAQGGYVGSVIVRRGAGNQRFYLNAEAPAAAAETR